MRQVLIRLTPTKGDHDMFAEDWRRAVSRSIGEERGESPSAKVLFHHVDEPAREAKAPVSFLATRRWVGVLATGPEAIDAAREHLMEVIAAANRHLGACSVERHDLELGYESARSQVFSYSVPQLLLPRDSKRADLPFIHRYVLGHLHTWGAQNGIDLNLTSGDLLIHEVNEVSPAYFRPEQGKGWFRPRAKVRFSMPVKLKGYWFASGLSSKGYGLVNFQRQPEAA